jgi:hypothetical protein
MKGGRIAGEGRPGGGSEPVVNKSCLRATTTACSSFDGRGRGAGEAPGPGGGGGGERGCACGERRRQGPRRACFSRRGAGGEGSAVAPEGKGRRMAAARCPARRRRRRQGPRRACVQAGGGEEGDRRGPRRGRDGGWRLRVCCVLAALSPGATACLFFKAGGLGRGKRRGPRGGGAVGGGCGCASALAAQGHGVPCWKAGGCGEVEAPWPWREGGGGAGMVPGGPGGGGADGAELLLRPSPQLVRAQRTHCNCHPPSPNPGNRPTRARQGWQRCGRTQLPPARGGDSSAAATRHNGGLWLRAGMLCSHHC